MVETTAGRRRPRYSVETVLTPSHRGTVVGPPLQSGT